MKKRISVLLVMIMIFSMTSSFVFAEGLDAASAPADETTVDGTEAEGTVQGETPEEVTEPVAGGEENAEVSEEGKVEEPSAESSTLGSQEVTEPEPPVNPEAPEAITGFATYSAYQSVVLEWNKPVKTPARWEIWSDNAKIADVTTPGSPYDNPAVYNYQCTNASDEEEHTYFIKAVYIENGQEVSVQSEVLTDQMLMPMYVRCTFKGNAVLHAHDGSKAKHKFKKGDVVKAYTFVKGQYRFYYKDHLYYCNYYRLTNKKALFNGYKKWNYSDREVEYFINTSKQTSMTKYILFVNLYTQHLYILKGKKGSKGKWKVTTLKYKGKEYRDWEVASGKATSPTPGGLKLKYGKKLVNIYKKSGVVYGHQTRNWNFYHSQTALHGRVGKNIYGKPRSLGCIRNTDARAIFIRNVIPMKTRVVVY